MNHSIIVKRLMASLALVGTLSSAAPALAKSASHAAAHRHNMITIDARGSLLSDVINLISHESGINIVPDASLPEKQVTLHMSNVSLREALATLTQAYNLEVARVGQDLVIGTSEVMNRRYGGSSDFLGAETRVFPLRNSNPKDVKTQLLNALPQGTVIMDDDRRNAVIITANSSTIQRAQELISSLDAPLFGNGNDPTGLQSVSLRLYYIKPNDAINTIKTALANTNPNVSVVSNEQNNALVVTGTMDDIAAVRGVVRSLDQPGAQVSFEVRVADITPINEDYNFGLQWGGVGLNGQPTNGSAFFSKSSAVAINATLNFLSSKGHAKILATPRVTTLNNKEASILIGESYPVSYYDPRTATTQVQFINAGVKLKLTPTIGPDGSVTAEMHAEYSSILGFQSNFPIVGTRSVDSTLRVKDGQEIILGGLLNDITSDTVTKVPWLGDIPILGGIFRNRQRTETKDEIVFIITPHVLTTVDSHPAAPSQALPNPDGGKS